MSAAADWMSAILPLNYTGNQNRCDSASERWLLSVQLDSLDTVDWSIAQREELYV